MTSKDKRGIVYEGYTLPRLTIKELLARNARKDSELKNFHKQLDKEKQELESDFSKTRSHLISRVHNLWLEGQTYDLSEDQSGSDEDESACENGAANDKGINDSTSPWETSLYSALRNLSSSQVTADACIGFNQNPRQKQQWAEKVAHLEHATKTEPVSASNPPPTRDTRRKISWGGRTNVMPENWDVRSELSKASSEGNLSASTGPLGDASRPRFVRRHTVGRSNSLPKSVNPKNNGLTKEALQSRRTSTSKRPKQRRHTVCSRLNGFESRKLTPTEEEGANCPVKKPLSDILSPVKLPPIYLQESKGKEQGKKCDKSFVNKDVRIGVSKSVDAKRVNEDLHYCRYLRIRRTSDSKEYPW